MRKSQFALAFFVALSACAGTPPAQQGLAQECTLADQDATGTKITKAEECKPAQPTGQNTP